MANGPNQSPTSLPPRRIGRRLNRVPAVIAVGAGCVIAGAVAYTLHERASDEQYRRELAEARPQAADAGSILKDAPDGAIQPVLYRPPKLDLAKQPTLPSAPKARETNQQQASEDDNGLEGQRKKAWLRYWDETNKIREQRFDDRTKALTAKSSVSIADGAVAAAPATAPGAAPAPSAAPSAGPPGLAGYPGWSGYGGLPGLGFSGLAPVGIDTAGQQQKVAWSNQAGATGQGDVLPRTRAPAPYPYMLMTGSFVPAVLINDANSDVPGQIVGMVDQAIYDSAGRSQCPLIPQGAKVVGTYNTSISAGQDRLQFAWTRIIYPDNSSVDLGQMPGADESGAAGAEDEVNHHLWAKIGNAILIAGAGALAQLSQPLAAVNGTYNAQQVAAAQLGQQFGQLGAQYGQQGLSIPNTINIRNGYPFVLEVTKDIALPPWPCPGDPAPAAPIMTISDQ